MIQAATEAAPAPPVQYSIELLDKRHEHGDVWSFRFARIDAFEFRAGQYVHLRLDAPELEKPVHHMSFASAPDDPELLFTMHIRPQSQWKLCLARYEPGRRASLFKVKGDFVLPDDPAALAETSCVFIANGIGITPFRSILRDARQRDLKLDATLIHVSRGEWLFAAELLSLPAQKQQRIVREELQGTLEQTLAAQPAARCFVAGSPGFVSGQQTALLELGVAEENILLDNFKAYDELD